MNGLELADKLAHNFYVNLTPVVQLVAIDQEAWKIVNNNDPHYDLGFTSPHWQGDELIVLYCPGRMLETIDHLTEAVKSMYLDTVVYHLCLHIIEDNATEEYLEDLLRAAASGSADIYLDVLRRVHA